MTPLRLVRSGASRIRSAGFRPVRLLVCIVAVGVLLNVMLAPLFYDPSGNPTSPLHGQNESFILVEGRQYELIKPRPIQHLSHAQPRLSGSTGPPGRLVYLRPNTTIASTANSSTPILNIDEAWAVIAAHPSDLRVRPVSMKQSSHRDDRHYFRFQKTMISDANTTMFRSPWGGGPNCSLVDIRPLPAASVIIAFHDHEQLSLILHTVHSIIQRTPKSLLKEIILIDDFTHKDDLQQILLNYIKSVFDPEVVRLYRSREPLGLIRARNLGAQIAKGEVLVCMDSHMEVQPHWLERLLYEINLDSKTLATSHLDWFEYIESAGRWRYTIGGRNWITYFDWQFGFGFQGTDPRQTQLMREDPTRPVESPVTVGTIWAISRRFFFEIGAFDEKMQKWGGENLDLPIRVWLFGGRVVNVPCSAAGHYEGGGYRDYRKGWEPYYYHNYKRIAEVWFGDYKQLVYYYQPKIEAAVIGDISDRQALTRNATRDITWFLDTIYPQLPVPHRDSFAWGMTRNMGTNMCLEAVGSTPPEMYPCGNNDKPNKQNFLWNKNGELRFSLNLIDLSRLPDGNYKLINEPYIPKTNQPGNAQWIHWKGGPLMEWRRKLCLETSPKDVRKLKLAPCNLLNKHQQWEFLNYTEAYHDLARPIDEPQNLTMTQLRMRSITNLIIAGDITGIQDFLFVPITAQSTTEINLHINSDPNARHYIGNTSREPVIER